MERIYTTLEDGEPSINIINYAKRVREKQKRKQHTEHHKTISKLLSILKTNHLTICCSHQRIF